MKKPHYVILPIFSEFMEISINGDGYFYSASQSKEAGGANWFWHFRASDSPALKVLKPNVSVELFWNQSQESLKVVISVYPYSDFSRFNKKTGSIL